MGTVYSPSLLALLFLARVAGLAVAVLVLIWALAFKSSFLTPSLSQQDLLYAVLHPLLMVIGFILLSGEAILVHRWLPGSRGFKKLVHLWLQGVALGCGIFGIWTRFQGKDGIVANFFSLHSWMGLVCVSLFAAQVFAFTTSSFNISYIFIFLHCFFPFLFNLLSCFSNLKEES